MASAGRVELFLPAAMCEGDLSDRM
jgi:hypothetical protein